MVFTGISACESPVWSVYMACYVSVPCDSVMSSVRTARH